MNLRNKIVYLTAKIMRQLGYNFNEEKDRRILAMKKEIRNIGGKIEFKIEQYPDGSWTAESVNLDGVITGGRNTEEVASTIKDAIFTYFCIPPHLCEEQIWEALK